MNFKYILKLLLIVTFISCSDDSDDNPLLNETEGLIQVQDIVTDNHTIELFTENGLFYTGYNKIYLRIQDNSSSTYYQNATINWMPIMSMETMNHSCPKSNITKAEGTQTLYTGYIIYQMTSMDNSGWSLTFNYTIDDQTFVVEEEIEVQQSDLQNVSVFTGSNNVKYVLALIEPKTPEIAINDLVVGLYKMEDMMTFPIVDDYTISLDPRMPGMGNHTSPNNSDLTYYSIDQMYHGDLSLTMTGYWVLNLKLIDDQQNILKGEDVTETNPQSSLYLELEF